ncbi:MAG: hypothetical protein JWO95_1536 [Verrucomicrobiales bacterium]|nr:hypothetical protein [Verrucomicrobiales bacterium]
MSRPFEQQRRESDKAFAAFTLYLNMGAQRSTAAVGKKLGKSEGLIERWCAKHDWKTRVQAFSAHLAVVEREAIEALAREKAIDWHKLHEEQKISEWKARTRAVRLANILMDRMEANENKCGTAEGIARLLEILHKLGRSATGMPSEVKEVRGELKATLEIEWEMALKKAYPVAAPRPNAVDVEIVKVENEPAALPASKETK